MESKSNIKQKKRKRKIVNKKNLYWHLRRLSATTFNIIIFILIVDYLIELHEYISTNISNWLDYEILMNAVDPNHAKLSLGTRIWRSIDMESQFFSPPLVYILLNKLITKRWITRSIGQKIFHLKVTRIDGSDINSFIAIKRLIIPCLFYPILGYFFSANPYELYFAVFILILIDYLFIFRKDRQCLHDLIAGTKVVSSH